MKGSYILVFHLEHALHQLGVGKLGRFDFAPGHYLYVGSAFGPGGLPARLAYHQRRVKAHPHWHIDYLRPHAHLQEAWTVGGPLRLECHWCEALVATPGVTVPVPGFGSRDTGCTAHCFYLATPPNVHMLTETLLANIPLQGTDPLDLVIEIQLFDDDPAIGA